MCEALNAYLLKVGGGETGTGGPLELLAQAGCDGSAKTSWVEREYIWGPGDVDECLMQIGRQGERMFVLNDGNNNVVGLTGPTGAMLEQYTYEPYGALIRAESLATHPVNKLGHQGLFFDHFVASTDGRILVPETTGLYYNRNRHYSPTMGRFLQRDPNETGQPLLTALPREGENAMIGGGAADMATLYGDGSNLYQFVGGNPVNRSDPLGLFLGFLDLTGSAGLANDLNGQTLDIGMKLLDAVRGIVGIQNYQSLMFADMLGQTRSLDSGGIDAILSSYGTLQTVKNTMIAAGVISAGAKFAAVGFRKFASSARNSLGGISFKSFGALKQFLGSAGPGRVWHHIVEQAQERKFGTALIHNVNNVIAVPIEVNVKLNAYYSSKRAFTGGMTVREWLRKHKSFEEQWQFGFEKLRELGAF